MPEALTVLINTAMQLERERYLGAESYERNEERRGYANGYKPTTVKTRVGELTVAVSQVRAARRCWTRNCRRDAHAR